MLWQKMILINIIAFQFALIRFSLKPSITESRVDLPFPLHRSKQILISPLEIRAEVLSKSHYLHSFRNLVQNHHVSSRLLSKNLNLKIYFENFVLYHLVDFILIYPRLWFGIVLDLNLDALARKRSINFSVLLDSSAADSRRGVFAEFPYAPLSPPIYSNFLPLNVQSVWLATFYGAFGGGWDLPQEFSKKKKKKMSDRGKNTTNSSFIAA